MAGAEINLSVPCADEGVGMTDYSGWTDEQVNEAIAVKRGWVLHSCVGCNHDWWMMPDGGVDYNQTDPPDYTHDRRLAGELLEEMLNCSLRRWGDKWVCGFYDDKGYLVNQATVHDTPQRAICEAWLAWKELQ